MELKYIIDFSLAAVFLVFLAIFLYRNKKNVSKENMMFPLFYAFLYRGKFGIKFLEKFTNKFREWIKLYGYISIGVGFIGMIFAIVMIFYVAFRMVFHPAAKEVAPYLPFISVPGLGYITFLQWIVSIFIIVIVHEASHAIVCLSHGLKIKNTGFGLFAIFIPFLPAAFVEPDDKEVKKKSDVIQYSIFAAGPMSNFVLMIPLLLMLMFVMPAIENKISEPVGFSFDAINDSNHYPASLSDMKTGNTFNYFNGVEYNNVTGPYAQMMCLYPNQTINFGYYNKSLDKYSYYYAISAVNHPTLPGRGFLGVNNIRTVYEIKEEYRWFEPIFSWFDGLLMILFVVTFGIGLINLFPAGMIDGGRMFMLMLFTVTGDKAKTEKIASILAAFFWVVVLFGFLTYFLGNPFSLFFK